MADDYDVVIVGGGITGAAICYTTAVFTDINSIALVEKNAEIGTGTSHHRRNSQTLHFGDIETNYDRETARAVKRGAELLAGYLEAASTEESLYAKRHKMVLGVGADEVQALERRYHEMGIGELFPKLQPIDREEIAALEPNVVEGRDTDTSLRALFSPDGYVVDYGATARSFARRASQEPNTTIYTKTPVRNIRQTSSGYALRTSAGDLTCDKAIIAAGGYGLRFASQLGYAEQLSLLPVAGGYVRGTDLLTGKVYTLQRSDIPFAAIHGDADVHDRTLTRFGPTALPVPALESGRLSSIPDALSMVGVDTDAFRTYANLLGDRKLRRFLAKNVTYHLPVLGRHQILPRIRKIVPETAPDEITRVSGGIRPQVLNTKTQSLDMGETRIVGKDIIFEIAPSPGASVCLQTAERDARTLVDRLEGEYTFDEAAFQEATIENFPRGGNAD